MTKAKNTFIAKQYRVGEKVFNQALTTKTLILHEHFVYENFPRRKYVTKVISLSVLIHSMLCSEN